MSDDFDPTDDLCARELLVVRDGPTKHALGVREANPPETSLKTQGWGALQSAAYEAIEETIDLASRPPGTKIATVRYDLDAWDMTIEFHVEVEDPCVDGVPLLERIKRRVSR